MGRPRPVLLLLALASITYNHMQIKPQAMCMQNHVPMHATTYAFVMGE